MAENARLAPAIGNRFAIQGTRAEVAHQHPAAFPVGRDHGRKIARPTLREGFDDGGLGQGRRRQIVARNPSRAGGRRPSFCLDFKFADAAIANAVLAQRRHRHAVLRGRATGYSGQRPCKPIAVLFERGQSSASLTSGHRQNAIAANIGYQAMVARHPQILSTIRIGPGED